MNWLLERLLPVFDKDPGGAAGGTDADPPADPPADPQQQKTDPPPADPKPEDTPEYWRERYTGLNRKYQEDKTTADKQAQKLNDDLTAAQTKMQELENTLNGKSTSETEAREQLNKISGEVTNLQKEIDSLTKGKERTDLIMEKFPDLVAFEAQGLIPDPKEGQELADVLESFQGAMLTAAGSKLKEIFEGATPPAPGGEADPLASLSDDDLYVKMMAVAGIEGKEEEYRNYEAQWFKRTANAAKGN